MIGLVESAEAAAWAQAVGTVASAFAAIGLILQERRARRRDEVRQQREDDRRTIEELRSVKLTIRALPIEHGRFRVEAEAVNNMVLGLRSIAVSVWLPGTPKTSPIKLEIGPLPPHAVSAAAGEAPSTNNGPIEWEAVVTDLVGARWRFDKMGTIERA